MKVKIDLSRKLVLGANLTLNVNSLAEVVADLARDRHRGTSLQRALWLLGCVAWDLARIFITGCPNGISRI